MANEILTIQDYINRYKETIQANMGDLADFSPGSVHDMISGAFGVALNEVAELLISQFQKTYFATAEGQDLDTLAVDHFGGGFARPVGQFAKATLVFSRATDSFGDVVIPAGFVVQTVQDARGQILNFSTDEEVTLDRLTVSVSATAEEAGTEYNVLANRISVLESPLPDPSIVATNPSQASGGTNTETDEEYKETIKKRLIGLSGATKTAIVGTLLAVPSIAHVAAIEEERVVIEYDLTTNAIKTGAEYFRIPQAIVFVADAQGGHSDHMIASAELAIENVRACGVNVIIIGATTNALNVAAQFTLTQVQGNPLSTDIGPLREVVRDFIVQLPIGSGFIRSECKTFVLARFSAHLATFELTVPAGNIAGVPGSKLIPGTITLGAG